MPVSELTGRTALVLGASRGLGRAIALTLAREGAAIVVTYHSRAMAAQGVVEQIEAMGSEAIACAVDAGDAADVERLWGVVGERFGTVDIVVVNVGGDWKPQEIVAIEPDHWRRVLRLEQDAVFYCLRAALPSMRAQRWGRVVLIGGHAAELWPMDPPVAPLDYPLGKTARHWMARNLGERELRHGITVNAVAPSWLDVPDDAAIDAHAIEKGSDQGGREGPGPQDVAEVAAFLCTERARFVSGSVIDVAPPHFPDEASGRLGGRTNSG